MMGRSLRRGVTVGVPVAPRCTPLVAAVSGTDLARSVAGGSTCSPPVPSYPAASASARRGQGWRLRHHVSDAAIAAPLKPVSRRRTIPGTVEGTEIRWARFAVNADRPCVRVPGSVVVCR